MFFILLPSSGENIFHQALPPEELSDYTIIRVSGRFLPVVVS